MCSSDLAIRDSIKDGKLVVFSSHQMEYVEEFCDDIKTQRSETQVSVQKLPVGNHFTNTASIMAYGYNPDISSWSPYHGAQYAVVARHNLNS